MSFKIPNISEFARFCSFSAIILEVTTPKPGNVYPGRSFADTAVHDFLISAAAIGPSVARLAERATLVGANKLSMENIRIGRFLFEAVSAMKSATRSGNTIFGTILMHLPIIVAASCCHKRYGKIHLPTVRKTAQLLVKATTVEDAIDFYRSISIANVGGLDENLVKTLPDARMRNASVILSAKGFTLRDVMHESAKVDRIAAEWDSGFSIVFDIGYPTLITGLKKSRSFPEAIGHCFLTLLSKYPDTLIAKKKGARVAQRISADARSVMDAGSYFTESGLVAVNELDRRLRDRKNTLNPGATADLTSASILIALLLGLK